MVEKQAETDPGDVCTSPEEVKLGPIGSGGGWSTKSHKVKDSML